MKAGLPDFFKHNLWANRLMLDALEQLTDEQLDATIAGVHGSIRQTLIHMLGSEEAYVATFHPQKRYPTDPPIDNLSGFPGLADLRQRAERSGNPLIKIAAEADMDQIFWLEKGTYEAPAVIVAIQAYNHGVDHRSQICTIMTQLGIQAPNLDPWAYNDARLAGRTPK